jgi:hypothetical protein
MEASLLVSVSLGNCAGLPRLRCDVRAAASRNFSCISIAQRCNAKIGQGPGTPRSSCAPRDSNSSPDPTTVP